MNSFKNGFIKIMTHRHYYLGLAILVALPFSMVIYNGNASKLLVTMMALTIIADLLCWKFDANSTLRGKFYTFKYSTKKDDENV